MFKILLINIFNLNNPGKILINPVVFHVKIEFSFWKATIFNSSLILLEFISNAQTICMLFPIISKFNNQSNLYTEDEDSSLS